MATAIGEREGGAKSGDKENNSNSENANKMSVLAKGESSTDTFTGAFASGSVIGGAAGLLLQLRAGSGAFEWKAVPYSMARGALAFGSALGIYEATNCKLKQTGVMGDLPSSIVAGGIGTGVGGFLFSAFPWTRPNSTKIYAEKFKQFQREIPKNFAKYVAIGGVYFGLESVILSKYFPDQQG